MRIQKDAYKLAPERLHIMKRDPFVGIADPTRRAILAKLVKGRMNLTEVGASFDMSRQSLTKHIKILAECGLLWIEREGRESYCHARPEKLREVMKWIERYLNLWTESYDRLDEYLMKMERRKKTK